MEKSKDLADVIRDYLDEYGKSESDIAEASGGDISQGYVNDIKNRKVLGENMTIKKLRALASGMGMAEKRLIDIARGVTKTLSLPEEFSAIYLELKEFRQHDLFEIARLFYNQQIQSGSDNEQKIEQKQLASGFKDEGISLDEIQFEPKKGKKKKAG